MSDLPLPSKPSTAKATVRDDLAPPLVMVVDDHADTRDMLRFAIEISGYRVVEASDGEEAIRLAESMLPNLILMDTSLPLIDGYIDLDTPFQLGPISYCILDRLVHSRS